MALRLVDPILEQAGGRQIFLLIAERAGRLNIRGAVTVDPLEPTDPTMEILRFEIEGDLFRQTISKARRKLLVHRFLQ